MLLQPLKERSAVCLFLPCLSLVQPFCNRDVKRVQQMWSGGEAGLSAGGSESEQDLLLVWQVHKSRGKITLYRRAACWKWVARGGRNEPAIQKCIWKSRRRKVSHILGQLPVVTVKELCLGLIHSVYRCSRLLQYNMFSYSPTSEVSWQEGVGAPGMPDQCVSMLFKNNRLRKEGIFCSMMPYETNVLKYQL